MFFAVSGRDQLYWTFPFNASYLVVLGADCFMPTGAIFVSRMAFPGEQSVAAALFQTLLQLGASFGLTLTTVIATATTERATAAGKEHVDALLEGFHASFWLSAALCFTALLLALVTLRGIGIVSQVTRETFKKRADKEEVVGAGPGVEEKAESSEVKESAEEPQPVPLLNEQSEKS